MVSISAFVAKLCPFLKLEESFEQENPRWTRVHLEFRKIGQIFGTEADNGRIFKMISAL